MGIGRNFLIGTLVICAFLYVGIKFYFPTYSYNYNLALEVDTPNGPIQGNNVYNVSISFPLFNYLFGQTKFAEAHTGDAAFIDLGTKNLVVLNNRQNSFFKRPKGFPFYKELYGINYNKQRIPDQIARAKEAGPLDVPLDQLPMLVFLRQSNDFRTMIEVDPLRVSAALGQGYRIRRATIQITDEPITHGLIEMELPWLGAGPKVLKNKLPYSLYFSNFKSED